MAGECIDIVVVPRVCILESEFYLCVLSKPVSALLTIAAVALFAFQGNDLERGYIVEVTFCFYMEVSHQLILPRHNIFGDWMLDCFFYL